MLQPDDFADLDAIIAEDEARKLARGGIGQKRERLSHKSITADERARLMAEIEAYDLLFVWRVTANVALFHSQTCSTCGSTHRFFKGWFTQQDHRTDAQARRLVAGRSTEHLPERIETHNQGQVEMCADCAECCMVLDALMISAEAITVAHEQALALDAQRTHRLEQEAANAIPGIQNGPR